MIDKDGHLRCNKCGKEVAISLEGKLTWYCPRCNHFNKDIMIVSLVPTWLQEYEKEQKLDS